MVSKPEEISSAHLDDFSIIGASISDQHTLILAKKNWIFPILFSPRPFIAILYFTFLHPISRNHSVVPSDPDCSKLIHSYFCFLFLSRLFVK